MGFGTREEVPVTSPRCWAILFLNASARETDLHMLYKGSWQGFCLSPFIRPENNTEGTFSFNMEHSFYSLECNHIKGIRFYYFSPINCNLIDLILALFALNRLERLHYKIKNHECKYIN